MRDPDLVGRAQRAAAELERAWDRWRTMHGLGTEPLPPVSSYVGYSLQEPWGQPRVVFGIDAGEAEQLAALLDRHDCAGPVYASVASRAGEAAEGRPAEGRPADGDRLGPGRLRVPSQAQPVAPQRERPRESAPAEALLAPFEAAPADALLGPLEPTAQRDRGLRDDRERDTGPAGPDAEELATEHEAPAVGMDSDPEATQIGPVPFRPHTDLADYPGEGQEPDPIRDEPAPATDRDPANAGWTRASRVPGGHALPRQKRAGGAGKNAGSKQAG